MDDAAYYWMTQARMWRKRARAAELHAEKLLRRCSKLDQAVTETRTRASNTAMVWALQIREAVRVRKCIEDAERVLGRYHRGTNGKEMKQIVDDALAFLRVAHPSPDGGSHA